MVRWVQFKVLTLTAAYFLEVLKGGWKNHWARSTFWLKETGPSWYKCVYLLLSLSTDSYIAHLCACVRATDVNPARKQQLTSTFHMHQLQLSILSLRYTHLCCSSPVHVFVLVAAAQDLKSPVLFSLCRLILCDRCGPPGGTELELFSKFFLLKHMNQLRGAALAADTHARSSSLHVEPSAGKELMSIMSRAGLAGIKTGRVASSWVGVGFQAGAIRRGGLVDTVGRRHKCSLARRAGDTGMAHFCIKLVSFQKWRWVIHIQITVLSRCWEEGFISAWRSYYKAGRLMRLWSSDGNMLAK